MSKLVKSCLQNLCFLIGFLILWQITYYMSGCADWFLPAPHRVWYCLTALFQDGSLTEAIKITLQRIFYGYGLTLLIGIPVGMLCYLLPILNIIMQKFVLGLQSLPSICWVPLTILWFGQTSEAILFVIVMGSLWSLIGSTEMSVRNIPTLYIRAARTLGSHGFDLWRTVIFPATLPSLVSGMKQSWAFAWRSLMSAEIYVSTLDGLGIGQLLHYGREMQAMDQVLGMIFVIIALGLLIEKFLFSNLEKFLQKQWGFLPS